MSPPFRLISNTSQFHHCYRARERLHAAGVLPGGLQITFDPVSQVFSIPLTFSQSFAAVDAPIDLGFEIGDSLSLSTTAHAAINANVTGGLSLFVDLDGQVFSGTGGNVALGSKQFSSAAFTFTNKMVDHKLTLGGESYEIKTVTGPHQVTLDRNAVAAATNAAFKVKEGLTLGISDAHLGGSVALDVTDLAVVAKLGFISLTAGGAGTGSSIHVAAGAQIVLDRNLATNDPADTQFSFSQIVDGTATNNIRLDFTGDASAHIRGLKINVGLGGDLPIPSNAEVGIYVQDLLSSGAVKTVLTNPSLPFDLAAARAAGTVTASDIVVAVPDLSSAFDFSQITFEDIITGIRTGIDFLNDSLADEPFYNTALPVINRSLAEVFTFADEFAAKLDAASKNSTEEIQEVEGIIERALGINDNNSLDPQDQKFSLRLKGNTLDMHVRFDAVFSDMYQFNLDLGALLPDVKTIGELSDLLGGRGNIRLDAFVNLTIDVGIQFGGTGGTQIFLYDYRPTRELTTTANASLFLAPGFADGSSDVTEAMYQALKSQFVAAIAAAKVGQPGNTTLKSIRADVVSAIEASLGANANTDSVFGAGQLLGRRQVALVALQNRLQSELGAEVVLLAADQIQAADAAALGQVDAFQNVKITLDVPVATNQATGTHLSLGARILGTNLELGLQAGPIKIGVRDGYAVLDGDGNRATDDYATFTVAVDQKAGTPNDDGKFHTDEKLGDNIQFVLTGGFDVNLPVKLDMGACNFALANPLRVQTNPAYADQGLRQLFNQLTNQPLSIPGQKALTFTYPDFESEFKGLGGDFSILSLINDPSVVLDGIDNGLGAVQDVFDSSVAQDIPLIGDKLHSAALFLSELRTGILKDLRTKLSGNGKLIEVVQHALFDVFGPGGLSILRDNTHNGTITIDDVVVGWYDKNGVFLQTWTQGGNLPDGADAIQFNVGLGGVIVGGNVSIPLNVDLPGFSLNVSGGFGLELGWAYDFGFGLSTIDGFYLTTNVDAATPEFRFDVKAYLTGSQSSAYNDVTDATAFQGDGKLLFFKATLHDNDIDPVMAGFQPSGVYGDLTVDYSGNSRNRLTYNRLVSTPLSKLFTVNFGVDATLDMAATLEVDGVQALPKVKGDFKLDWGWSLKGGAEKPHVEIDRFRVDVASFVSDFLQPIADKIQGILGPLKPLVNGLTDPIAGLDAILPPGTDPNMLGLINLVLKLNGKPQIDPSFFKAARALLALVDQVQDMVGTTGEIYLGTIQLLSKVVGEEPKAIPATEADLNMLPPELKAIASLDAPPEIVAKLNEIKDKASGGSKKTERSGFKALEYIKDINNWLKILQGGDATLFTYQMPILELKTGFDVTLATILIGPVPVSIKAFGKFSAKADLSFGYDTYGIREAFSTGNPLYVLDGFYVSDFSLPSFKNGKIVPGTGGKDIPEFTLGVTVGVSVAIDIGFAQAGLQAGIDLSAQVDLQDIGKPVLKKDSNGNVLSYNIVTDGKIHGTEIVAMFKYENPGLDVLKGFSNLFNFDAKLDLFAGIFADVFGERILDLDLFRITLYEFEHKAPFIEPKLAKQVGSTLYVNVGSKAADRKYFNTTDGDEKVYLTGEGGTVGVEFDGWYETYSGVTKVVADMGDGNDLFDAHLLKGVKVDVKGADGNDTLYAGSAGGTLDGGDGDDKLIGNIAAETLLGGEGADTLDAGAGDDRLVGGDGNDALTGGDGHDTFVFEDGYGKDRFNDASGDAEFDFSKLTAALTLKPANFFWKGFWFESQKRNPSVICGV
ncbi:MAG: hypothetical protein NT013_00415 [Planctomycetia bacterium]|nr:hypothetical protein [Planctomycetia bacterium]